MARPADVPHLEGKLLHLLPAFGSKFLINEKTGEFLDEGSFCCLKWYQAGVEIFIDHDLSKEVKHITITELVV